MISYKNFNFVYIEAQYHYKNLVKDLLIMALCGILYIINILVWKNYYSFMKCYFNDILAGFSFLAYTNIVLFKKQKRLNKFGYFVIIAVASVFWEYCSPLINKNSTSDVWDLAAYFSGAICYYGSELLINIKNRKKSCY